MKNRQEKIWRHPKLSINTWVLHIKIHILKSQCSHTIQNLHAHIPIAHSPNGIWWKSAFSRILILIINTILLFWSLWVYLASLSGHDWLAFISFVSNTQVVKDSRHIQMWTVLVTGTIIIIIPRKSWSQTWLCIQGEKKTKQTASSSVPTDMHSFIFALLSLLFLACLGWVCSLIKAGRPLETNFRKKGRWSSGCEFP